MPADLSKVKAIMFDLDNTLVDFMRMKWRAIDSACDAMIDSGLPLTKSAAIKKVDEIYTKLGIEYHNVFDELLKETMGKIDPKILAVGVVSYRRVEESYLRPYPNTISTLTELIRRGYRLGIISDAPVFQVWSRLAAMSLHHYFEFAITFDDTKIKKPGKLPFRSAIKKLRLRPYELLMIGDDPRKDVAGAKNMGIPAVLAGYGCRIKVDKRKQEQVPDYKIANIKELLQLLPRIK